MRRRRAHIDGMRGRTGIAAALLLAVLAADPAGAADGADGGPPQQTLRIGHSATVASELGAELTAAILRRRLGYAADTVLADVAALYSALGGGRIDLLPGAWTPDVHRAFLQRVAGRVERLGTLYTGARVGWLVPTSVPERLAAALPDLRRPDARAALGGRVRGGEAGSGAMRLSRRAIARYRLEGWTLEASSHAGAALALRRAVARGDAAVATGRRPHWIHGALPVRFLADPQDAFGGPQQVRVLARAGFAGDHPWAARLLGRIGLELETVQRLVERAHADGVAAAVDGYLRRNHDRIDRWVEAASR